MRKAKELLINFIRGFCMALADSVPGVSGGTIAFLLGFYDRFIGSLDDLFHGKGPARVAALSFLVKLAFGWIVGFGLSAAALTSFFDSHIYEVSSLFMGFIVFAIPIVALEEKRVLKGRARNLAFAVLGAALVVAVTLLNPTAGSGMSVAVEHLDAGLAVYVFFAAMVAITAMVLPGISGSTLLLIFGLYVPIMGAVRAVMGLDMAYLPILLVFAAGVAAGVLVFVRLIRLADRVRHPRHDGGVAVFHHAGTPHAGGAAAGHGAGDVQPAVLRGGRPGGGRPAADAQAAGGPGRCRGHGSGNETVRMRAEPPARPSLRRIGSVG